jgi:5'-nucleotidase
MRFLCSNDDGIFAHGLECLIKAAESFGEVTIVAPDREQSATSHSLTLHHPIRPVQVGKQRFQVDGTPTDCVMLGVEALMTERPDFVLSGVNHGQNMGEDVLYSGTVAAAMEGLMLGIPSIAFSFAGGDMRADPEQLESVVDPLRDLLKYLIGLDQFPQNTLLNVNFPPGGRKKIKGTRVTRLGRRVFANSIKPMTDPWGRPIYWIGAGSMSWSGGEDSDYRAVEDGYISVTPLHLDLTNQTVLDTSGEWWQAP